jgi:hypothetical protein
VVEWQDEGEVRDARETPATVPVGVNHGDGGIVSDEKVVVNLTTSEAVIPCALASRQSNFERKSVGSVVSTPS